MRSRRGCRRRGRRVARPGQQQRLHASREQAAHRDSSDQDRAPSGRGQVLAGSYGALLFGASDPPPLCKWDEMPVHLILEQRLPRRQGVSRRTLHSTASCIEENRCSTISRSDVGSAADLQPVRLDDAAGRGASAWSFYWCDAAGDDGRHVARDRTHRLRAPAAVGSAAGAERTALRKAAASISSATRRWSRR